MSELREPTSDRPEDRPPIDVGRIKEQDAAGDAKAFDPTTRMYDPLDQVQPRGSRPEPVAQLPERPQLLSLRDKVRAESKDRFDPPDAEQLAANVDRPEAGAEHRDPEQLHRFGGTKEVPRSVRLSDLDVKSWDEIVKPYAPTRPSDKVAGVSTFIDPHHPDVRLSGNMHRLPPDYQPPAESGLAIHADGVDVSRYAPRGWGHRTIYATEAMTAAEFDRRVADLPWEYAGKKDRS